MGIWGSFTPYSPIYSCALLQKGEVPVMANKSFTTRQKPVFRPGPPPQPKLGRPLTLGQRATAPDQTGSTNKAMPKSPRKG
jgi:hypothetical protein